MSIKIVKVAIDIPIFQLFDYIWDEEELNQKPKRGQIVKVEFGKKINAGIVLQINGDFSCANDQDKSLKRVIELAQLTHIDEGLLRLCQFASKYYLRPLGEILFSTIPTDWKKTEKWEALEKQRNKKLKKEEHNAPQNQDKSKWLLNNEQQTAYDQLIHISAKNEFELILLKGITGSGKTAVYLNWLKKILEGNDDQCLILVPEINLTPQLEKIIRQVFINQEVSVLHSNISPAQRNIAWWKVQHGMSRVILGTRLSIFAPIPRLKAIVVDEEHDGSYKQQDGLRYNARDLAIWRGVDIKIPVLLTSATPSSETWQKVIQKKITLFELTKKAKEGATISQLHLIDLNQARKNKTIDTHGLTSEIKKVIQKTWEKNKQVLVFINRRGYSPILHCGSCQWKSECKKCSAWMVVHKKKFGDKDFSLQCHHCGLVTAPPVSCPICGNQDLATVGMGTQKIEEHLSLEFPQIEIMRIDSDSTKRKGSADEAFSLIHQGRPCLIVGTQMVTKGHDFQHVETVIVLDVDKSLYSQDFRAIEKMFSQLVQVAGRGGRSDQTDQSNIYIQTEFVNHPLFTSLANHRYDDYITEIVLERKENQLPPYAYQALIIVESVTEKKNLEILYEIKGHIENQKNTQTTIYDPTPRMLHKHSGIERNQILIESKDRIELQSLLETALDQIEMIKKKSRSIKIHIDRDPTLF
jgi:primosomal protein N' (replication factor Y)